LQLNGASDRVNVYHAIRTGKVRSTACSYRVRHIAYIFNYENKPIIKFDLRFECSNRKKASVKPKFTMQYSRSYLYVQCIACSRPKILSFKKV
jgi:hypothetical protein